MLIVMCSTEMINDRHLSSFALIALTNSQLNFLPMNHCHARHEPKPSVLLIFPLALSLFFNSNLRNDACRRSFSRRANGMPSLRVRLYNLAWKNVVTHAEMLVFDLLSNFSRYFIHSFISSFRISRGHCTFPYE